MSDSNGGSRRRKGFDVRIAPRTSLLIAGGMALGILASACGGGSSSSTATTTAAPPSTAPPTTLPQTSSEPQLPALGTDSANGDANTIAALAGEDVLAKYSVQNGNLGQLVTGKDDPKYRDMFNLYTQLIPANNRQSVTVFAVYVPKPTNKQHTAALVVPNDNTGASWLLGANPNSPNRWDLADSFIHETNHLLTIGGQQTNVSTPYAQCSINLGPPTGCPNPGSYLNAFITRFWPAPLVQEWQQAGGAEANEAAVAGFYQKHASDFVRDYAASNPREDIAESFAAFVMDTPGVPPGVVAKEQFFQAYPQLVAIKTYAKSHGLQGLMPPPPGPPVE